MSWSIALLKNTVEIPESIAQELFEAGKSEGIWTDVENVLLDGKLYFDCDHMEHMDYLGTNEDIVDVLKKHCVQGDVCFGDVEGDNSGSFWGYRFDGEGGMQLLEGEVVWKEKNHSLLGKSVVITGTLQFMSRAQAQKLIEGVGGTLQREVSKKTDILVVGTDCGQKLSVAKRLGVPTINEKEFIEKLKK